MKILPTNRWEQVRKHEFFTEDEELAICMAVKAEAASGFVIDETQLSPELREKVKFHFLEPVPFPARVARAGGAS
jgi:hypothetical protein